ncbi:MAG: hypothetical protein IPG52_15775 [Rhodocyclaceae bacterium]|nr:hypothetical protein [Rhodocyclaceae bacterium]
MNCACCATPTRPPTAAEAAEAGLDPLDHRIAIIRAAAERQRLTQKAREDMVRFISHDIRSVLVSIIPPHRGCRRPQRQGSRSSAHRPLRPARPGPG